MMIKVRKSRAAAAAVICAGLLLSSCSAADLFGNLPGENATELYDSSQYEKEDDPEVQEEVSYDDTQNEVSETVAMQTEAVSAEETKPEEKKVIILSTPDNSAAAEYFLDGESEQVRAGYQKLLEGIYNFQTLIEVERGVFTTDQMTDLINLVLETAVTLDLPDSNYKMYVDGSDKVTKVEFSYKRSFDEGNEMYKQVMTRADEIASGAESLQTEYEKIKYFHDTIINNCVYDTDAPNGHGAYGALCEGRAVCDGYAKAFQLLCERASIRCLSVQGDGTDLDGVTQSHMWNKVNCDGIWYNVDVTWDDPKGEKQILRYDYFMIDDTANDRSHKAIENQYMKYPECVNAYGDFYTRSGLVIGYDSDISSQMYSFTAAALTDGWTSGEIDVRCLDSNLYEQVVSQYFIPDAEGNKGYSDLLRGFMQPGESIAYEHSTNPSVYTIHVTITKA